MPTSRLSLLAYRPHFTVERIKTGWRWKCRYCKGKKVETRSNTPDEHERCRRELITHLQRAHQL